MDKWLHFLLVLELLQQVKMMTESGDQNIGWQDDSCASESSSEGNSSVKNNSVCENNEKPVNQGFLVTLITL
ncbi:hypothetical protein [Nitrosomonas sp. Nm51]|uniref:hypothetical protein n=1 Tax=Nitrosomonas sp. Nm51 TaxID=133720 RepID=UPI00115F8459|nr:hypothetical protein [Nitrosomonas sp. Nm51]